MNEEGSGQARWQNLKRLPLTCKISDLDGEGGEDVVAKIQDLKVLELSNGLGEGLELVGGEGELLQVPELADVVGKHKEVVVAGIQLHQHGQLKDVLNEGLNVVGANDEPLQLPEALDGGREGVGVQAVLAKIEGGQVAQLRDLLRKGGQRTIRAVQLLQALELLDGGCGRGGKNKEGCGDQKAKDDAGEGSLRGSFSIWVFSFMLSSSRPVQNWNS